MLTARTFLAWKDGEEREDCQDSIYPLPDGANRSAACYAVADGATTSFFSATWANILTRRFAADPERALADWFSWLGDAQEEWRAEVELAATSPSASFFVVNGVQAKRAAAAAFVGVILYECTSDGWPWRAAIVGDSCLFRLSGDGVATAWKLRSAHDFTNVVEAAESRPIANPFLPTIVGSEPGMEPLLVTGEVLIITTDALAKWLLLRAECKEPVWGTISSIQTQDEFRVFIDAARSIPDYALQNDDVALAVLRFGEPNKILEAQTFAFTPKINSPASPQPTDSPEAARITANQLSRVPTSLRIAIGTRWIRLISYAAIVVLCIESLLLWRGYRKRWRSRQKAERLTIENVALRRQIDELSQGRHVEFDARPAVKNEVTVEKVSKDNEMLRAEIEMLRRQTFRFVPLNIEDHARIPQPPLREDTPQ